MYPRGEHGGSSNGLYYVTRDELINQAEVERMSDDEADEAVHLFEDITIYRFLVFLSLRELYLSQKVCLEP